MSAIIKPNDDKISIKLLTNKELEDMGKRKEVAKDYQLINAQYQLTAVQTKLIVSIISLINRDDQDFFTYQIPLSYFEFLIGSNNHARLKKECLNLMTKPLQINTDDGWKIFHWFSHIEYKKKEKLIECSISPKLKPYLLKLSRYGSYKLHYIMPMKSEYSIRVYEILKNEEWKRKVTIALEDLHLMFKTPQTYRDNFGRFKTSILNVAQKEISEHTDIYFDYTTTNKKGSKKVESITFKIYKNIKNQDKEDHFMRFKAYVRKHHVNEELSYHNYYKANIRINTKGLLYFDNGTSIEKEKAEVMWKFLYEKRQFLKIKFKQEWLKNEPNEHIIKEDNQTKEQTNNKDVKKINEVKRALGIKPTQPYNRKISDINFKKDRREKPRLNPFIPPPMGGGY